MTTQAADVYKLLHEIRHEATVLIAKANDALTLLAELNISDLPSARCPKCELELRGPLKLAEHIYQSHDGPLPDHYAALDARALPPAEPGEEEDAA